MNDETQQKDCEHLEMPQSVPRGLLRHVIPRILMSQDLTGTEIMHELHTLTDGEWNPSPGTIYPLLSSLEEDGIIQTTKTEGRSKTYSITEEGRFRMAQFVKHRRQAVGHKTRLGPRLWERLLEPNERVRFHMHGMEYSIEALESVEESLNNKDRQRLLKHLEEMSNRIASFINHLKSGGT
jgi:DNA-binding PadR family transcriptional regulator